MFLAARFVFRSHSNRSLPADRAFMFADPAADAALQIYLRALQPDLNFHGGSRSQRHGPGLLRGDREALLSVTGDPATRLVRPGRSQQVIITTGKLVSLLRG